MHKLTLRGLRVEQQVPMTLVYKGKELVGQRIDLVVEGVVMSGAIEPDGRFPVTTDGGVMSYNHAGASAQMLQRVLRGVQQLRGTCASTQIARADVAMCSNGGSGALFTDVILLGVERP